MRQAYFQSAVSLSRNVFFSKPVPEFDLKPSECFQLLKPLYGLCESGDHWHRTLDVHHKTDLVTTPLRSDPALYILLKEVLLKGLSGGYVEDFLRAGNKDFEDISRRTLQWFDMDDDQMLPCTFTGFALRRDENDIIFQDQHEYLRNLEEINSSSSYK